MAEIPGFGGPIGPILSGVGALGSNQGSNDRIRANNERLKAALLARGCVLGPPKPQRGYRRGPSRASLGYFSVISCPPAKNLAEEDQDEEIFDADAVLTEEQKAAQDEFELRKIAPQVAGAGIFSKRTTQPVFDEATRRRYRKILEREADKLRKAKFSLDRYSMRRVGRVALGRAGTVGMVVAAIDLLMAGYREFQRGFRVKKIFRKTPPPKGPNFRKVFPVAAPTRGPQTRRAPRASPEVRIAPAIVSSTLPRAAPRPRATPPVARPTPAATQPVASPKAAQARVPGQAPPAGPPLRTPAIIRFPQWLETVAVAALVGNRRTPRASTPPNYQRGFIETLPTTSELTRSQSLALALSPAASTCRCRPGRSTGRKTATRRRRGGVKRKLCREV